MAGVNGHHSQSSSINNNSSLDSYSTPPPTSYELAYHHHLQTALQVQMGQFYTPSAAADHLTAALRNNASGNPASGGAPAASQNGSSLISGNRLPSTTGGSTLWDNGLGAQRGSLGYSPHQHQAELLSVSHGIDLWPTPVPTTNGRTTGQRFNLNES